MFHNMQQGHAGVETLGDIGSLYCGLFTEFGKIDGYQDVLIVVHGLAPWCPPSAGDAGN
jgi:predicted neuraminidase